MHNANGICVSVHVGEMDLYIRFWDFQLWDYVNIFKKIEAKKTAMGYIMQDHLQQNTIALADNKNITDRFEELAPPILNQIIALRENHKFDKATR